MEIEFADFKIKYKQNNSFINGRDHKIASYFSKLLENIETKLSAIQLFETSNMKTNYGEYNYYSLYNNQYLIFTKALIFVNIFVTSLIIFNDDDLKGNVLINRVTVNSVIAYKVLITNYAFFSDNIGNPIRVCH